MLEFLVNVANIGILYLVVAMLILVYYVNVKYVLRVRVPGSAPLWSARVAIAGVLLFGGSIITALVVR